MYCDIVLIDRPWVLGTIVAAVSKISVIDLHTTGPSFKTRLVWYIFYQASD